MSKLKSEPELTPPPTNPPDPVPEAPKKKRGRPPGSKNKPREGGSPSPVAASVRRLHPQAAKYAALGPFILASGIASRFFDSFLVYDPDDLAGAQEVFEEWMAELDLDIGPGWQYAIICATAIGAGIRDAEPISLEMRNELIRRKAAAKAARVAAKVAKSNGAAAPPATPPEQSGAAAA